VNASSSRGRNRDWVLISSFLTVVAAACVYRATTQGIVHDEAVTYLMFVAGPLEHVFTRYTANNHVLFTLAANATTHLLGVTELTLRLPSIIAAVVYILVAALLARRVSSTRLVCFLTLGALTLNPLVFDFLSAARGYGLALCLFVLALLELSREPGRQRWLLASLALGGSISANLAFAFPAAALWAVASAIALTNPEVPTRARVLVTRFWLPGILAAAAFLAVPLQEARLGTFFFGAGSLFETVQSIVSLSVEHHPTWWTRTALATWTQTALTVAVVVTAASAGVAAVVLLLRSRRFAQEATAAHWLLLYGGTLSCTILLLLVAHVTMGLLYPKGRTGLYFIPLIVLMLAATAGRARSRTLRWSATAVLAVLTLTAVEQFTVRSYGQWHYDAGSRRIAELISRHAADRPQSVRVAATQYLYQPALEFYRTTRYPHRLAPVADGFNVARAHDFDFVVVTAADASSLGRACRRLYVDSVSGAEVHDCVGERVIGAPNGIATTGTAHAP
jgi:hypothetical protein